MPPLCTRTLRKRGVGGVKEEGDGGGQVRGGEGKHLVLNLDGRGRCLRDGTDCNVKEDGF